MIIATIFVARSGIRTSDSQGYRRNKNVDIKSSAHDAFLEYP